MSGKFDVDGLLRSAQQSAKNFDANAILRGAQLTVVGGSSFQSFNYLIKYTEVFYSISSSSESRTLQI